MAKRVPVPHLTAWEWLCRWARQHGVEPELVQMSDAAEHLVMALEQKRAAGNPLPRSMVQLTALLVRITGELEIEGIEPTWAAAVVNQELANLPAGVRLEPGRITVEFKEPQQALENLLALAMAISNDFERFERSTRRERMANSKDNWQTRVFVGN